MTSEVLRQTGQKYKYTYLYNTYNVFASLCGVFSRVDKLFIEKKMYKTDIIIKQSILIKSAKKCRRINVVPIGKSRKH